MKLLMVSGSRSKDGQTAQAVGAFLEAIERDGHVADQVFLPQMKIERCRQCDDNGWGTCRLDAKCTIQDDFDGLLGMMREADAVAFATPVYFGDLSESLKALLDRLRRVCRHEGEPKSIQGKPAIGICVAGGGGGGAMGCAASLEKILLTCGFDVVDMVPARRQNLEMKLDVLRTVGKWFGDTGRSA